ncbi:MAG: hypothetical protein K2K30_04810 [Alistipes sp.]|nr:hypothetical protein [Alistipes sp.]MDE6623693.1 hypothetical protein [Alistipes sp.]
MTRHERLLARTLLDEIRGATPEEAVERLFAAGLADLRACERRAIHDEVERLGQEGMPRCEALCVAAEKFSCSYEKARRFYYEQKKTRKS